MVSDDSLEKTSRRTLPQIEYRKKWWVAGFGYLAFCGLYTLAGASPFRAPTQLIASPLDELVPFMDWTVWVYNAQFFFLFFCIAGLRQRATITRTFYAMGCACLISFAVFFSYPTTVPRLHPTSEGLTGMAFGVLYGIDSAANCFPSLHVSLAWLAAIGVFEESRRRGALALLGATLISLSTLTTKQHYAIDVLGGLALVALCRAVLFRVQAPVRRSR